MAALRVQMHLHGNPRVLQRDVINEGLLYAVHIVILVLQQECWRRSGSNRNFWIQFEFFCRVFQHVSWIDRYGEIWTAADFVGLIHWRIGALREVRADIGHQVSPRRKP